MRDKTATTIDETSTISVGTLAGNFDKYVRSAQPAHSLLDGGLWFLPVEIAAQD